MLYKVGNRAFGRPLPLRCLTFINRLDSAMDQGAEDRDFMENIEWIRVTLILRYQLAKLGAGDRIMAAQGLSSSSLTMDDLGSSTMIPTSSESEVRRSLAGTIPAWLSLPIQGPAPCIITTQTTALRLMG